MNFDPLNQMSDAENWAFENVGEELELEASMSSEVWLDEETLKESPKEQLIQMLKIARTELKRQIKVMDAVKDKLKVGRSVGYFRILEYESDNPPQSETLMDLSKKYLGGDPVVGLPKGTSLTALDDRSLKRLGLKRTDLNEASRDTYEEMLSRSF